MATNWILITHDYPPLNGGVARYLADLVQASQGKIRVILPTEHGDPGEKIERRRFFRKGPIGWWPLVDMMRSLKKDTNTQLFISHVLPIGTAAWVASFFGGPRYTILFHGLDLHLSQRSVVKRFLTRQIVQRAQHICVNSAFVARECKELFPWVMPVVLTPGYVQKTLPTRDEARAALKLKSDDLILLNVTRLIPRKGLDKLIEALPSFAENVRAVSIGDGADRTRLEGLATANGARITFLGAVDHATKDLWYAAADIFVFPVRKDGDDLEGYGIVCLEAAAAGLPVITGMNGGAPETVIPDQTGLVVQVENPDELRAAIQRLVDDPALRLRMGERGRDRVLKYNRWSDRWDTLSNLS